MVGKVMNLSPQPLGLERLESRLQFAAGALNTAFVGTGILKALYKTNNDFIDTVIQKDGRIVCVGQSQASGKTKDALIVRFNADGTPDSTFGSNGVVNLAFTTTSDDIATGVAIDPVTKRIVVAGITGKGTATDMFIARYTTRGKPDTTFNGTGKLALDFGGQTDGAVDVLVESDSQIVASGFTGKPTLTSYGTFAAAARVNSDGQLDSTFAGAGKFGSGTNLNALEIGTAIAQQADGKYLIATTRIVANITGFSTAMGVMRLGTDGLLEIPYGSSGRAHGPSLSNKLQIATSVAVDPVTGNAVVAGTIANGKIDFGKVLPTFIGSVPLPVATSADFQVMRFKASNGALDTSFSGDGVQPLNFKTGSTSRLDVATTVQVDSKSRVYVAGASQISGQPSDFAAARLTSTGKLDSTFDGDGLAIYNIGGADAAFGSVKGSGQIFLVGTSRSNAGKNYAILASVLI